MAHLFDRIDRVLLLAPHADDIEFSCGGTVKKLAESGYEIWYAAFSPCNKSLPDRFPEGTLYEELKKAVRHLGIDRDKIITYNFPVRDFPAVRQEILEELIVLKREISPQLIFLPNEKDIHQDHRQIYEEGLRAFKTACLLSYELPWNNFTFHSNFHVELDEKQLEAKVSALQEYKSQGFRLYSDKDFIYSWATNRGMQIGRKYAEAFELVHWIA